MTAQALALVTAAAAKRRAPTRPYNAAAASPTPTYDGSGHTVHPSVVDMVALTGSPWNGWRYWMAHTPYTGQNDRWENPSISVSHDGLTWQDPAGVTNPIDPAPPAPGYNSDTELAYDPEQDRMVCFWRDWNGAGTLIFCCSESTDGVTWTPQRNLFNLAYAAPNVAGVFSPAVVRVGPGDWRAYFIGENNWWHLWTATDPTGTWSGPTNLTFNGTATGGIAGLWHGDVILDDDGVWRAICSAPKLPPNTYRLASSLDGITWSGWSAPVMNSRPGQWDQWLYRATILHAGRVMRCWYSAMGADGHPRVGYTEIPLTEWP